MALLPNCLDHILAMPDGKKRYCDTVLAMTKAFALCGTTDEAMALNDEMTFLQAIRAPLLKGDDVGGDGRAPKNVDFQLRQLLSESLVADGITDVFRSLVLKNQTSAFCPISSWQRSARSPRRIWRLNFSNGC